MPRKIKADGRTITVPDDATDDEINQIVGAAPAGAATTPPPPTPPGGGFTQPVSDQFSAAHPVLGAASNFGGGSLQGFGETVKQLALHPFDSLYGMVKNVMPSYGPGGMPLPNREAVEGAHQKAQEIVAHPAYEAGRAIGGVLGGEAVGGALGGVAKLPSRVANAVKSASGAGTGTAAKLVTDTAANNAEAIPARAQELQEHFEKTRTEPPTLQGQLPGAEPTAPRELTPAEQTSRKVALNKGVEALDPIHKGNLEDLQGKVRAEANRRYNELNANLDPEPAPQNLVRDILHDAADKLKGPEKETPLMAQMHRHLPSENRMTGEIEPGDPTSYRDLQGWRSRIGTELAKGNLPGDVYTAYKGMIEDITNAMSDIAEGKGMGDKFDAARSYYKQMSDTFDDPKSPLYKALKSAEPYDPATGKGGIHQFFVGKNKTGIGAVAKYDPDLAQSLDQGRKYLAEIKSIKPSQAQVKPPGELPPSSVVLRGPEDIQAANAKAIGDTANALLTKGNKTTAALGAMLPHLLGLGGVGADLASGALAFGAKRAAAMALSHPDVIKFLSEPSAAQIAELEKLPPEQRTAAAQNLQPLIEAAQGRGVKVAHALTDLFAVAGALPAGHPVAQSAPLR